MHFLTKKTGRGTHRIVCAFVTVLAAAVLAVSLSGCVKSKTFSKAGMSISLTSEFTEKDIVSQTVYYESRKCIVTALKEEFSLLPNYSLSEYTDTVKSNNKLTAESHVREGKDYMYFTYEKTASGKNFYYLATTHKSDDAFWLIQFICEQSDKDKYNDKFLGWADTITFTATAVV